MAYRPFYLAQDHLDRNGSSSKCSSPQFYVASPKASSPEPQTITGRVPFSLMKPEKLVSVMQESATMKPRSAESAAAPPSATGFASPGLLLSSRHIQQQSSERARNLPRRHRPAEVHHQAPVLLRYSEKFRVRFSQGNHPESSRGRPTLPRSRATV